MGSDNVVAKGKGFPWRGKVGMCHCCENGKGMPEEREEKVGML